MTVAEVADKLRGFLQGQAPGGTGAGAKPLLDTTLLREEWRLTSLGILQTVSFIEDEFDVSMTQRDINPVNFSTVISLANFVLSRMK